MPILRGDEQRDMSDVCGGNHWAFGAFNVRGCLGRQNHIAVERLVVRGWISAIGDRPKTRRPSGSPLSKSECTR